MLFKKTTTSDAYTSKSLLVKKTFYQYIFDRKKLYIEETQHSFVEYENNVTFLHVHETCGLSKLDSSC